MTELERTRTILWVEDNAQDPSLNFIPEYIEERGLKLREAPGVAKLARVLDDIHKKDEELTGIILDMLIYGASDLSAFGLENVVWDHDATDVGFILLKHILRSIETEAFQYLNEVPILILTVKPNVSKSEINKYANVEIAHKYDDGNPEWEEDVMKWLRKL